MDVAETMPDVRWPTPGPWEIRPFGYPVAEDGMWVPQIGAEVHPYADVVARVGVLGGRRAPERVVADARYIVACANAVFRLAEHLDRDPLEVAEGLDLVAMMRERDEARREVERLRRVAEAAEAVVSAQDARWRIGLKGEAERNGAIERLRSALAEWRRVRGE